MASSVDNQQSNVSERMGTLQLTSATFCFTIENVSRSEVKTTFTPVLIGGVEFHCVASHIGDHLEIALVAGSTVGVFNANVKGTIRHQNDSALDILRSINFVFMRQNSVLRWITDLKEVIGDGAGFVANDESLQIEVCIVPLNLSVGEKVSGSCSEANDRENRVMVPGNENGRDTVSVTAEEITSSENGAPSSPQSTLPLAKKNVAHQLTQTEAKLLHQLTQPENKVNQIHQFTQTEDTDKSIFSSKVDFSVIAKTFECIICLSLFQPPISICSRGHSICSGCRRGIQKCPVCNGDFSEYARNFALEHIMDYVLYLCPTPGCPVRFTLSDKEKHKLECTKREFSCPSSPIGGQPCTWKGVLDQFETHFHEKHNLRPTYLKEKQYSGKMFSLKNYEPSEVYSSQFFLTLEKRIFSLSLSKFNGHFYACVKMYGTCTEVKQFTCEVRLDSKDPAIDYNFSSNFQVHCDLEKVHGKCISLSTMDAMKENGLIDADDNLTISVRIYRK